MYYFKVQAYNKVGSGPYTKIINVSTTHENPVPLLLVYSSSGMQVLDMDLQIDFLLNEYRTMEFAYSALEQYTLKLALSNFYVDKLSMGLLFGSGVILTTPGNAPEDVTVQVLTPTLATVYWMPPKNLNCVAVNYEIKRTVDGKFFTTIQPLLPGQKYLVYVRVYPVNFSNFFNDSLSKSVYMYSEPNNLILSGVSTNGINISWIPSINLIHYIQEYKNVAMRKWQIANNT
ncbi:proto-oncogene tyrosine-protein kinase ros [Lasius niger]|uniref:Proto-oncogene tyrosine-protein kinase ros n=1 Tax=Lasius niger TaxID=67767 RepID=A0A0J7N5C4_LASNI|nr:proto-oncogene tyrosine-protein kinase ros [Lasius niger]